VVALSFAIVFGCSTHYMWIIFAGSGVVVVTFMFTGAY
jgi:hypothetical protein